MINDLRKSNDPEYHSVYLSIKNNKWYDDVKFSNKDLGRNKYDNLNTVEDFQSFIDSKDDIHSERDFRLKYPKEYSKATNIGNICGNLKFEFRHRKPKDNTKYNSIDEIQALINSAGYLTIWEFKKRNHNAWTQHFALQKKDNKSLVFRYVSTGSKYEDNFVLALQMYGICYIPQYTFKGFIKNNGHYRYDFYLPDKNVIIEVNGEQHFGNNPDEFSPRFNVIEEQENDKIKYEYATDKEHIPVYYFTYCLDRYKTFGYFRPVYTDIIKLLNDIGYTDLKEVKDFSSEENIISEIQKFINRFNIKTFEELNTLNYIFGSRVILYNLSDKLIYKT